MADDATRASDRGEVWRVRSAGLAAVASSHSWCGWSARPVRPWCSRLGDPAAVRSAIDTAGAHSVVAALPDRARHPTAPGAIVEQGTHRQLMELGGHYARLYTTQADAYR